MEYLLDTHTFLWFINGEKLNENVLNKIESSKNKIFLSVASIWEIAIKLSLNKLSLEKDFARIQEFLINNDVEMLDITFGHLRELLSLPHFHRDPFDRLIIAQAINNKFTIITKDEKFEQYSVDITW